MGQSSLSASQTTKEQDISTGPISICGFGLVDTIDRAFIRSKRDWEYAFLKNCEFMWVFEFILEGKPPGGGCGIVISWKDFCRGATLDCCVRIGATGIRF